MSKRKCIHTTRPVFSDGRCLSCARTFAARNKIKQRGKKTGQVRVTPVPINKISDRRKILNIIYDIVSKDYLRTQKTCEIGLPGCRKKATQIHHTAGRAGLWLIASTFFKATCDGDCHGEITNKSKEAVAGGHSLYRNRKVQIVFTKKELALIEKYKVRLPASYVRSLTSYINKYFYS